MNKKLAEQLRAKNIHNDWDITKDGHPMIHIHLPSGYRDVTGRAVVLALKGRHFKDQPWYHNGDLWFAFGSKEDKKEQIAKALAWVANRFPDLKMVPSPFCRNAWVVESDLLDLIKEEEAENDENDGKK